MQCNVGREDKIVRFVAGAVVIGAGFYYGSYLGVIGVVLVFTALFGLCPVYSIFGISTCKKD
ncbi:MAG TPA: DUF2892 domain-containing protein [Gammaproteobacteria bacterium]|jgi:hypothetical protein|nr:DUF2892 domain-containing protein [Gammaproteobacteria bacterium]HAE04400.1 DUF2892 domain-containing protein [Gammaproteobacteria bacterium]HAE73441.1 DUF2892 domain-containing protein [Gammaproteobacteria bacterium]HAN33464.1 DUF2892 domain-containing protein [Gammaproteobacteria bacterium]HAO38406.1 DUF2892 domain-containing protein [Gammaproteobacteria bacterium]